MSVGVSHKAKDVEKLEKYAYDIGSIVAEIDDDDKISVTDREKESISK